MSRNVYRCVVYHAFSRLGLACLILFNVEEARAPLLPCANESKFQDSRQVSLLCRHTTLRQGGGCAKPLRQRLCLAGISALIFLWRSSRLSLSLSVCLSVCLSDFLSRSLVRPVCVLSFSPACCVQAHFEPFVCSNSFLSLGFPDPLRPANGNRNQVLTYAVVLGSSTSKALWRTLLSFKASGILQWTAW